MSIIPNQNKRIMRLLILMLIISIVGCQGRESRLPNFSKEKWIRDSLGCLNLRWAEASILDSSRDLLVGKSFTYLSDLLGKPNQIDSNAQGGINYKYYIERGRQCDSPTAQSGLAVAVLYIVFGKNRKASKMGIAVP